MKKHVTLSIMLVGIFLCLFVLIASIVSGQFYRWQPPEQGKYNRTIRVVSDADYEPISFYDKNGNPAGHDVELIYKIGELIGANIELELLDWTQVTKRFYAGEYDVMLSVAYAPERESWLEYSVPIMNEPYVVFGEDAEDFSVAEMSGSKVAIMAGDVVRDAIFTTYELEGNISYYPTYIPCFERLASGDCDYVIAPKTVGLAIIRDMGLKNVEASNAVLYNSIYCIAVQKDDAALAGEINDALRTLSENGEINKLYERWMQDYVGQNTLLTVLKEYKFLFILFVLVILFFFIVQVFYYEINRNKQQKRATAMLQRERMQYRDALLHDCEYAFSFDLNEGMVHELLGAAPGHKSLMEFPVPYSKLIERLRDYVKPVYLLGSLEEQYPENLVAAYERGERLLEIECFHPMAGMYQRKNIFLSKDEENGHILACVITRDITKARKEELETKRSVSQLANAAEQITHGNLDVEIDCALEGDIGILANVFQMTVAVLKQRLKQANNVALADTLTGIGNRTAYDLRMKEYDAKLEAVKDIEFSVVMVDLNDLKQINDTLGHEMGDQYIVTAVEQLKKTFGDVMLYRVGGDEFIAIFDHADRERIAALLRKLEGNLSIYNQTHSLFPDGVGVAVGTATYEPGNDRCFKDVFTRADARMYEDKQKKKSSIDW